MRIPSRPAITTIFIFLIALSLSAKAKYPQTITTSTPFINLPRPSDDPRWATAFSHWDQREDAESALAAVGLFEAIARDAPDRLESQLWLCRSYFMAGLKDQDQERRQAYMSKAVDAGDRALALDPGNGFATYWRFYALAFTRDLTVAEYQELRAFGAKMRNVREMPVPDDDPLWAEAMRHWDARGQKGEGLATIEVLKKLERKHPERIEPKMWLCRAYYWTHYTETTDEGMARQAWKAVEWGRKALAIEPRNPAAAFFTATGLGIYGSKTSVVNIVRYSMEMASALAVVVEEDPNYYYGGFSNYFASAIARTGELVAKMSGVTGYPLERIERLTVFGSNYEPNYLRNFLSLGEMYVTLGRMDEAKKALETVVNADPTVLKLQEPENRKVQEMARKILKESFSE